MFDQAAADQFVKPAGDAVTTLCRDTCLCAGRERLPEVRAHEPDSRAAVGRGHGFRDAKPVGLVVRHVARVPRLDGGAEVVSPGEGQAVIDERSTQAPSTGR